MNKSPVSPDSPVESATHAGRNGWRISRRDLVKAGASAVAAQASGIAAAQAAPAPPPAIGSAAKVEPMPVLLPLMLNVNGRNHPMTVDSRTTVLDALRENLALKGTKKGCDHGQCGACTVLVDGRRINSCLTLAVMHDGQAIITIEGLAQGETLHPMQAAFIKHDGFQCGYCTPGQICSSLGMLAEARAGMPSHVTRDLDALPAKLSDEEIRERMSGNLCRCSAYPNIVAAIRDVAGVRA